MSGNTAGTAQGGILQVSLEEIYYDADRKHGGNGDLEVLARSMERLGLINPVTLLAEAGPAGEPYRIIAGRRRFEAARLLGWPSIEAKVLEPSGSPEIGELALAENVNREDMSPLDEAELFGRQLAEGADVKELALIFNRSVSAIYQRTRLSRLSPGIKEMFREGRIGLTAAALIADLDEKSQQKFEEKYSGSSGITTGMAESFLHSAQKNVLAAMADKKCEKCAKRTRHTDRSLFPEEDGLKDVCFDDGCYAKKWTALLEKTLKKAQDEEGDPEEMKQWPPAVILENIPKLWKGGFITLNNVQHQIKKYSYYENGGSKGDPDAWPMWKFEVSYSGKLVLERVWHKEAKRQPAAGTEAEPKKIKSRYVADEAVDRVARKLGVELAPEDRKPFVKDLDEAIQKQDKWPKGSFWRKRNMAVLKKLALRWLERPRSLLRNFAYCLIDDPSEEEQEIYRLIAGAPHTPGLKEIETVDAEKAIALLFMFHIINFEDEEINPDYMKEDHSLLLFGGLDVEEYRELWIEAEAELATEAVLRKDDPEPEEEAVSGDDDEEEGDDDGDDED